MGWLFTDGKSRATLVEDLTRSEQGTRDDNYVTQKTLKHCYRGNRFRGVLWSVVEITAYADETQQTQLQQYRRIRCDLLEYSRSAACWGWGYKPLSEGMHPYYYSCPEGYLAMVPETAPDTCAAWRALVKANHAESREKQKARRLLRKAGSTPTT